MHSLMNVDEREILFDAARALESLLFREGSFGNIEFTDGVVPYRGRLTQG